MRTELSRAAELLRNNTPEAVEEALGLLQNTVFSFSMKVCGHSQDAEDTMQEVLYRSLNHLAKIRGPHELAVWLYTVTRNRCGRMRRKRAHAPTRMLSLDELMPDDAELQRLLQDAALSPEGNVLRGEQHQLLHETILRLPARLRIVLVLHDMEELTTEQVAQILDIEQGTVRIRLHRARLWIRKEMHAALDKTSTASNSRYPAAEKIKGTRSRRIKRPAECRDLFANLSDYLDGRVVPATCEEMRSHIEACPSCVAFLGDLRTAIDRCRSIEVPCDPAVALRLRNVLTREYLRLLVAPPEKNKLQ